MKWWKFIIPATVTQRTVHSDRPEITVVVTYERWLNFTWRRRVTQEDKTA